MRQEGRDQMTDELERYIGRMERHVVEGRKLQEILKAEAEAVLPRQTVRQTGPIEVLDGNHCKR